MLIKESQILPFGRFCIINYGTFFTSTGKSEVLCDFFVREVLSILMFNFLLSSCMHPGKISRSFVFVKLQCDCEFLKKKSD